MILRNHGLLTCGPSVAQAFNTMYNLELACRGQVDAMPARTESRCRRRKFSTTRRTCHQPGTGRPYGELEWHAIRRLLDAEDRNNGFAPYWH
ncbi:MAG: class II aldolase/adducin family protein [Burkholderiales bacterium]